MHTTQNTKAQNWKFNFNAVSEADREALLRSYHGDQYYESTDSETLFSSDAMFYFELNALIANGLIKTGFEEFIDENSGVTRHYYEVFTLNGLKLSDEFVDYYLNREDDECPANVVDAETNEDIHEILSKYRFWDQEIEQGN